MPFIKNILSLFLIGVIMVGCAQIPPSPTTLALQRAQAYLDHGNFQGAADIFRQLSEKSIPPERESFQMQALSALIRAGNNIAAKQVADGSIPTISPGANVHNCFCPWVELLRRGANPNKH